MIYHVKAFDGFYDDAFLNDLELMSYAENVLKDEGIEETVDSVNNAVKQLAQYNIGCTVVIFNHTDPLFVVEVTQNLTRSDTISDTFLLNDTELVDSVGYLINETVHTGHHQVQTAQEAIDYIHNYTPYSIEIIDNIYSPAYS